MNSLIPPNPHMRKAEDRMMVELVRTMPSSLPRGDRKVFKGPGGTLWAHAYCVSCGMLMDRVLLPNLICYVTVCDSCVARHGELPAPRVSDDKPKEIIHANL